MSTVRRVYFYTVSIITLGILAAGGVILLRLGFDLIRWNTLAQVETPGFVREQLSLGLALLVIGGALWFPFWRAVQRQVSGSPVEIGSAIRKLFLNIILVVTAVVGLLAAAEFLVWLLSGVPGAQLPSSGLANLIVAGAIWYYHWRVAEREGQPSPKARTLRRWYVYILSAWGLITLSFGLVQLINTTILHLPVWGETIASGGFWSSSLRSNLGWILAGGGAWAFHWFHMARGDFDSTLRQVYLYLIAILGGAIAGLVALTTSLFHIFRFALGSLNAAGDSYFQFLGWTVPAMLVAAAVWGFHQQVVREEATELQGQRLSARRVLFYLMSLVGLATLISGLIMLIGILLELLISAVSRGPVTVSPGWWRDQLAISLALLLVAVPLWLYYWNKVLQMATAGGLAEWRARSRRIFLYLIVGAAIITLAADLVNIVFQLLNGLLQGTFGVEALRGSKWSLQTMVVAIPVLWYHWRVLRQDQRLGAERLPLQKTVTLLAGETAVELVSRIEEKLGSQIRWLHHLGQTPEDVPLLSDEEVERLVSDIQAVPGDKVMLVAAGGKIMVLPYQEK